MATAKKIRLADGTEVELGGGGTNLVDLGELASSDGTNFTGTITSENYAKLETPSTVVKITIPGTGEVYGLINRHSTGTYNITPLVRNFSSATSIFTFEISSTTITGKVRSTPVIPVPSSSDVGKVLTVSNTNNLPAWQSPSGGGTPVGGGFTFTYKAELYSFSGLIFGQYNGVYGWIDASTIYDRNFTITNAVFVLNTAEVEDITRPGSSITAGSLYTVDGTEVTKNNMNTTINVLKVLTANCTIHVSD